MRTTPARRGYALLLVLVFLVLLQSLAGLAARQVGSALRIATAQAQRVQRDQGCVQAAARALGLLETGTPPSDPYTCQLVITGADDATPRPFTVIFAAEGPGLWSVRAAPAQPGDTTTPMPSTFAASPKP